MKINYIGMIIFCLTMLPACWADNDSEPCRCPDAERITYTTCSIDLDLLDNRGTGTPAITSATNIPKSAFGMRVSLKKVDTTACNLTPTIIPTQTFSVDTLSCFCPNFVYNIVRESQIKKIEVFTQQDFDENYPANSNISEYFAVVYRPIRNLSSADYVELEPLTLFRFNDYTYEVTELIPEVYAEIDLLLMQAPTINASQQFEVRITLEDDSEIISLTENITLE